MKGRRIPPLLLFQQLYFYTPTIAPAMPQDLRQSRCLCHPSSFWPKLDLIFRTPPYSESGYQTRRPYRSMRIPPMSRARECWRETSCINSRVLPQSQPYRSSRRIKCSACNTRHSSPVSRIDTRNEIEKELNCPRSSFTEIPLHFDTPL